MSGFRYQMWHAILAAVGLAASIVLPSSVARADENTAAYQEVSEMTFVAFDIETTGLSPKKDRVVEVGAVKFRGNKVIEEKSWLIHPGRPIPSRASDVHGITDDMVEGSPTFDEVYSEFETYIKDAVLIAHNANFDVSFLREEIARNKLTSPENAVVDSLPLMRTWYPDQDSYSLGNMANHLEVDSGGYHRALADSIYVMLIFNKGLAEQPRPYHLDQLVTDSNGMLTF